MLFPAVQFVVEGNWLFRLITNVIDRIAGRPQPPRNGILGKNKHDREEQQATHNNSNYTRTLTVGLYLFTVGTSTAICIDNATLSLRSLRSLRCLLVTLAF